MVPQRIADLAVEQGNVYGLEKRMEREYPKELKKILSKGSLAEAIYLQIHGSPAGCKECQDATRFVNYVKGYKDFCSVRCGRSSSITSDKRKATNMERFGAGTPMQGKKGRAKFEATMMERYGVKWALQSAELRKKSVLACLEKYGVPTNTLRKELIWDNAINKEQIQNKREAAFVKNLGVRSPLQVPEIRERQERSAHTVKKERIGGVSFEFRGYEGHVIRYLIREGHSPKSIATRNKQGLPSIPYELKGKGHFYFPDIWLKDAEELIEVKSIRTLGLDRPEVIQRTLLKCKAALEQGYTLRLAVTNRKGEIAWIKNPKSVDSIRKTIDRSGFRF